MKNILKTLDKKLGYLIFLFESHAIGNFLSFGINISLKSIWLSLQILMLSFNQKLSISRIKTEEDKALFWKKVFNSISVSFYSDLRTGIYFAVRFASDASKITVKKCSNLFEEIEYSDDEEEIRLAQNKIFRILSIYNDSMLIRRPFYHILKTHNFLYYFYYISYNYLSYIL